LVSKRESSWSQTVDTATERRAIEIDQAVMGTAWFSDSGYREEGY
jgi:hypothetical protein